MLKPRPRELTKADRIRSLSGQLKEGEHEYDSISFSNNWNEYRLRLQYHHGYRDAGLDAGHLKASNLTDSTRPAHSRCWIYEAAGYDPLQK